MGKFVGDRARTKQLNLTQVRFVRVYYNIPQQVLSKVSNSFTARSKWPLFYNTF